MTDADALLTQADRLARLQGTLSASFARELAQVLKDLERQIRVWAVKTDLTSQSQAGRAVAYRQELLDLLHAAGFDRFVDQASMAATERLVGLLTSGEATRATAFVARDLARVEALRSGFLAAVVPSEDELIIPLLRTVLYAVYGQRNKRELIDDLATVINKSEADTLTLYNTALSTYTRQVQAMKQDQGPDALFLYAGPVDTRLRPFCRERVGKVFTRTDIDAMDNKQLPNPYLTGGGYNCRHTWMAVPKESSVAAYVGTNDRVPEVASELAFMRPGGRWAA